MFDDYNFEKKTLSSPKEEVIQDSNLKKVEGGFSFSDFNKFSDEVKNISVTSASYKNDDMSTLKSSSFNLTESLPKKAPFTDEELAQIKISDIVTGYEKTLIPSTTKIKTTQQSFINPLDYRLIGTFLILILLLKAMEISI